MDHRRRRALHMCTQHTFLCITGNDQETGRPCLNRGKGVTPMPSPLTPEEFEAAHIAFALTIARHHERVLARRNRRFEIMMVTRAQSNSRVT
jgi:hypothetical protein